MPKEFTAKIQFGEAVIFMRWEINEISGSYDIKEMKQDDDE